MLGERVFTVLIKQTSTLVERQIPAGLTISVFPDLGQFPQLGAKLRLMKQLTTHAFEHMKADGPKLQRALAALVSQHRLECLLHVADVHCTAAHAQVPNHAVRVDQDQLWCFESAVGQRNKSH